MKIELASSMDEKPIKALLHESRLVYEDITPSLLKNFLVMKDDSALVGVVGLEVQSRFALLRSLAVNPKFRSRGYAARLLEAAERYSEYLGVVTLFMVTTAAHGFFFNHGFKSEDRMTAASLLHLVEHFQRLCPPPSLCLIKELEEEHF
ncbi:MAG: GNAT family N-acetyltransferase [Desulfobacterales bacterium]|nr:GNAT family N-acetyltransferase [Desulfobacterales bacterium]MDD4071947.1 GNAT family N-acetyltransferase [Desulfobacterales bacterium]MDD4393753.1 GNAT family N-acetyltransferase [Desulfobacterales bacterium]